MDIKEMLQKIYEADFPAKVDLIALLKTDKDEDIEEIYQFADMVRKEYMGDAIYLRGLIEFSNYCQKTCSYCGLNIGNKKLKRYRMSETEILKAAELIYQDNIRTIVFQSGEENLLDIDWFVNILKTIKKKYSDIAITLSLGEKSFLDYQKLRDAGADRYLLKMETYNKKLYQILHPHMDFDYRMKSLAYLKELGFQTGSGNIVGLKGQTLEDLANDIISLKKYSYDMVSVSPFIAHPETSLSHIRNADVPMVLKVLALTRIVTRNPHMPATTALGSMGKDYRIDAFKCGANIVMPNYSAVEHKKLYEIYPNKRCLDENVGLCKNCLKGMAESVGRVIGQGRGDSLK
ncbi:MAG: [FeFe] hydrogenase H-cluster radical SAM maturase HydE [bacterium]|nr:[FeFe] hydrogenase H-cluster radical SAM maturase HydE [bacterium]